MSNPELSQSAEENLRTIRSLMERATIYRAISAGPALLAGLLSLVVGIWLITRAELVSNRVFVGIWLVVLVVVDGFNTWLLYREAKGRGGSFPSASTLQGIRTLAPPMLTCGLIGLIMCWVSGDLVRGTLLWVLGYGLGLTATASFAPRSIRALGLAFVVAAVAWFVWAELRPAKPDEIREAARVMAATFGGFHLVYAARTGWWKRSPKA